MHLNILSRWDWNYPLNNQATSQILTDYWIYIKFVLLMLTNVDHVTGSGKPQSQGLDFDIKRIAGIH